MNENERIFNKVLVAALCPIYIFLAIFIIWFIAIAKVEAATPENMLIRLYNDKGTELKRSTSYALQYSSNENDLKGSYFYFNYGYPLSSGKTYDFETSMVVGYDMWVTGPMVVITSYNYKVYYHNDSAGSVTEITNLCGISRNSNTTNTSDTNSNIIRYRFGFSISCSGLKPTSDKVGIFVEVFPTYARDTLIYDVENSFLANIIKADFKELVTEEDKTNSNNNQNTDKIINNNNQNTQDIINNQDKNKQDIIDNQNKNNQAIIDNQNKNNQDLKDTIDNNFNSCKESPNILYLSNLSGSVNGHKVSIVDNVATFTIQGTGTGGALHFRIDPITLEPGTYTFSTNLPFELSLSFYFTLVGSPNPTTYGGSTTFTLTKSTTFTTLDVNFRNKEINQEVKIQLEKGEKKTEFMKPGEKICTNKMDETNNKLDDINSTLNDDTPPDADISALGNVTGLLPPGPLDSLLNIPFQFLSIVISSFGDVCVPLSGKFVFDSTLTLPCFSDSFYSQVPSSLMIFINLIPTTFLLIKYFKYLYKKVERATSLETNADDEWGCI